MLGKNASIPAVKNENRKNNFKWFTTGVTKIFLIIIMIFILTCAFLYLKFSNNCLFYPKIPVSFELVDSCVIPEGESFSKFCSGEFNLDINKPSSFFIHHNHTVLFPCCLSENVVMNDTAHQYLMTYDLLLKEIWQDSYEIKRLKKGYMSAGAIFDTTNVNNILRLYKLNIKLLSWPKYLGG